MKARWFVRGDWDGFIGLFIDNLLQLLLIATLCPLACGIPVTMVVTILLPGAAVSILAGNLFYSWQAWRLAEKTGRSDVTALPYGINTVSLIAFIFFIMSPVWQATKDPVKVWEAGVFACLLSGLFELAGAFCADPLRRSAPRAALLSALAGIALTFISMGFAFRIFASPAVALLPMLLIVIAYAGRIRLGIPAGLLAIAIGVGVAWILRSFGISAFTPPGDPVPFGFHPPHPDMTAIDALLSGGNLWSFLSVIIPMALFNLLGSLQTLESAEAAGDRYETMPSLAVNGAGTVLAAIFGSAFPTTLYIGHPGWKAMGARIGYSALNGLVITVLCLSGAVTAVLHVVPLEATLGILIWIGLVMTAQAFQETPRGHAVAVAMGLMPSLAAWAWLLIETTLRVTGVPLEKALPSFGSDLAISGVLAMNQGFLITSMALSAIVAFAIDRKFLSSAVTCFVCAALSSIGLIHAYKISSGAVLPDFGLLKAPGFTAAYAATGICLLCLHAMKRFDAKSGIPHG
ncbi:MAG: NCS2 family permease [Verrucomicrobiaceae bacterium]|nr:MAG: NCS2 family permease [Verrucomicrobiaceae bacterium]